MAYCVVIETVGFVSSNRPAHAKLEAEPFERTSPYHQAYTYVSFFSITTVSMMIDTTTPEPI
jgi:hypothetical protein